MGSSVDDRPLIEAVDEGVLTLTLDRPEQRNALDADLRDALAGALDRAARDPEVRAVVLTGAGGSFCAGGDLGSALACDWRVATTRARLLFREGRLNLVPTHGGVTRLVKLVGLARAKEALLGGDDLDAGEALRLGLLMELTDGDVVAAAHERARRMLRRAPLSFGAAKRLLQVAADTDAHSTMLAESLAQTVLLATADHREGLAAVRERREPEFTGR